MLLMQEAPTSGPCLAMDPWIAPAEGERHGQRTGPTPYQAQLAAGRDLANWATMVRRLHVTEVPNGVDNINVDGRRLVGAIQGFGQLWRKTYQIPWVPEVGQLSCRVVIFMDQTTEDVTAAELSCAWGVRSRLVTAGIGYQQVRSVVAGLAGDRAGAAQRDQGAAGRGQVRTNQDLLAIASRRQLPHPSPSAHRYGGGRQRGGLEHTGPCQVSTSRQLPRRQPGPKLANPATP
jgi:hypothetical protein